MSQLKEAVLAQKTALFIRRDTAEGNFIKRTFEL